MGIQRENVLGCSALIKIGTQAIYAQGDIKCTPSLEFAEMRSSAFGKAEERLKSATVKIRFTPVAMWNVGLLAALHPYTNPLYGASILGATDVPITIHPIDGKEKIVFSCGAVTKSPDVVFTHDEQTFKEMEIECFLKNAGDWSAADALYTLTASAAFTDTSLDFGTVPTCKYTVSLAGLTSPWNAIYTTAGVMGTFDLKLAPRTASGYGIYDRKIKSHDVTVKLTPINTTVADILTRLKLQGTGMAMGQRISAGAATMTVTGGTGNPIAVFNNLRLKNAGLIYGDADRFDALEFIGTRPNGQGALYSLGTAA